MDGRWVGRVGSAFVDGECETLWNKMKEGTLTIGTLKYWCQIDNKIKSIFGIYALPKSIYYLSELPKTRSGKILRRLLRDILLNPESNEYGDLSTILNSEIVKEIQYVVRDHEWYKF